MKHLELKLDSVKAFNKGIRVFQSKIIVVRGKRIGTRYLAILNEGQCCQQQKWV